MVLITLWAKSAIKINSNRERRNDATEDAYRSELTRRIESLEKDVRELRVELKNRDAEYLQLYQEHTTLKAKYEVLQSDYDQTVKELHETQAELMALKEDIKTKALAAAQEMTRI